MRYKKQSNIAFVRRSGSRSNRILAHRRAIGSGFVYIGSPKRSLSEWVLEDRKSNKEETDFLLERLDLAIRKR